MSFYSKPHQFEPLLPTRGVEELRVRSLGVLQTAQKLSASAHPETIASLRELVRAMNSYYSNRIEGQSTHPRNIERALQQDYSDKPDVAKMQRLALAHIQAEQALETSLHQQAQPIAYTLSSHFVQTAHAQLYQHLPPEDCLSDAKQGQGIPIHAGQLRQIEVEIGRHIPPIAASIPAFLKRYDETYTRNIRIEDQLIYIAAAHQRMAWVHPFVDGNGRAIRLQTHSALWPISQGLWSVARGMARQRSDYYRYLEDADNPRRGDLDGRGNLSDQTLSQWCGWFIGQCEDQVNFMQKMLHLDSMQKRIGALITFRAAHDKGIRKEAIAPLYHLYLAGSTTRGTFQQMTGLGERTARNLLARLLETGLVTSAGHTSPVRMGFPLDALQFLLPDLYPEAAALDDNFY